MTLPRVKLFLLGGTITMNRVPAEGTREGTRGDTGVVPIVDAESLCMAVNGLDRMADVDPRTDIMIASGNLTYRHAFALVEDIIKADKEGAAEGFVIVQGTDTLEEMAFLLDCLLDIKRPVVVTGAMRSAAHLSPDGPANILAAVTCAATSSLGLAGVTVVLNDDIHSARYVTKGHTGNLAAFHSPNCGPIGRVVEGEVQIFTVPLSGPKVALPVKADLPKIALITASYGDDGYLLDILEDSDVQAVVIEAFGAGHLPESYLACLDRMAQKMPIVLSSRVGAGHIFRHSYGYKGGEIDLIKRGLIPSGFLGGLKAKILLTLMLMAGSTKDEIERTFAV